MKLFIIKCCLLFAGILCFTLLTAPAAEAANPMVSGRVIMSGTNTPISNIWVQWIDSKGGIRYTTTDSNGRYTFVDLSGYKKKDIDDLQESRIDTNGDGAGDARMLTLASGDDWKSIADYFSSSSNPHQFTAILPAAWNGEFNTISGFTLNSAAVSMTVPNLIFTPTATQATPTPAAIYSIGGVVFEDLDRDGVQGASESAIPDVQITLAGAKSESIVTASPSGSYQFTNLAKGTYSVDITLPAGYASTTPSGVNVTIGTDNTIHFGIVQSSVGGALCTARINGLAFNDGNANGSIDPGETGLNNWRVTLSSPELDEPLIATTNAVGNYSFTNLCAGTYTLELAVFAPWTATNAFSRTLTVNDGQIYSGNNFGARASHTLSGNVFIDTNTSQTQDGAESGMGNATIFLSGTSFAQVTTDSNGNYSIPSLPAGPYQVSLRMPSGYGSTTANSLNINLLGNQTLDFGIALIDTLKIGGACNDTTADIVLVIDHSLSMLDPDPSSGLDKMEAAKRAAGIFVDVLSKNAPTARIGVVQFSNSTDYPNDPDASYILSELTTDYASIKDSIDTIEANGYTCIQCGVDLAVNMLRAGTRPKSQKMVVFMTDGLANQTIDSDGEEVDESTAENEAMYSVIDSVNEQNIIYYTIGVGAGTDEIDETFLTQMANTNGGSYYNNPTDGDLVRIYTDIANTAVASGVITGTVYNDANLNRNWDAGEPTVPNLTVELTGSVLTNKLTYISDSNGNYFFYGLCDGTYNVTEIPTPPWTLTTQAIYSNINVLSGTTYPNYNFGNRYGYTVSGSVFNDINKNRIRDAAEQTYTGGINISVPSGDLTVSPNGTYRIEGLNPGSYVISYTSPLPNGYLLVYPRNGPPASFLVTVGVPCTVDTTSGASCVNGDITNLNFAISNSIPWFQTYNGNIRLDNGITNIIPLAPLSPRYMEIIDGATQNPGIVIVGDSSATYGNGSPSSTQTVAGGVLYPELYPPSPSTTLPTAYQALLNKARQSGITVTDISTVSGCSNLLNCSLPGNLPEGVYNASGTMNLGTTTFPPNRKYVFLVNGTLSLGGSITVASGSSALFSAQQDITVAKNVAAASNAYPVPVAQLQGMYVAGRNFVIEGNNDCVVQRDFMLNVEGAIVVNALRNGGNFINDRDLCGDNPGYPSFTVKPRLDFFLNAPPLLLQQQLISHEVAP